MSKYYAVASGRDVGIYRTWKDASKQVIGYSGAVHKSFKKEQDAIDYMVGYSDPIKSNESIDSTNISKPVELSMSYRDGFTNTTLDRTRDVTDKHRSFHIYTDGSSSSSLSGFGFVVVEKSCDIFNVSEALPPEYTNNMTELHAINEALSFIEREINPIDTETLRIYSVCIFSDSMYCVLALNERCIKWEKRGWITSRNKPIANKELMLETWRKWNCIKEIDFLTISLKHVKAHCGIYWNEVADSLANEGRLKLM